MSEENEELKAKLQLYECALHRENEATHRMIDMLDQQNEFIDYLCNYMLVLGRNFPDEEEQTMYETLAEVLEEYCRILGKSIEFDPIIEEVKDITLKYKKHKKIGETIIIDNEPIVTIIRKEI